MKGEIKQIIGPVVDVYFEGERCRLSATRLPSRAIAA
jgi:hypothetical protein